METAASFEENMYAKNALYVDFSLSKKEIEVIKRGAKFAYEQGLLKNIPDVEASINQNYLLKAKAELVTQ